VVVADVPDSAGSAAVLSLLAAVGDAVDRITDPSRADPLVVPDGPGDLAVTIGIGPRLVTALDPALPGATALPAFASDGALDPRLTGGDLLVAVYSSDASVLHGVADAVLTAAPAATRRWSQVGVRGAGEGTIARNPLGFHDGVIVPRTPEELAENVWIGTDVAGATDATVAVIRRLRLDVSRFHAQPLDEQDRVIGRRRTDGVPLSGGGPTDQVNLTAKTPEGDYLVPLRSHVRAAHPSFTGSALMLRRGYTFSNAVAPGEAPDDGLLFMCYQRSLDTFTRTQQRLDETDDLMGYATATASASFLIVPGSRDGEPLGSRLVAA
jgi:dye decolorizing peroxidase